MIKVLLADDHQMVRTGIARMIEDAPDMEVLAELASGEEVLSYCQSHQPDVVLMDVRMPGLGGLETTRKLHRAAPSTPIIALSACDQEPMPSMLLKAGAAAYVSKGTSEAEMLKAIRQVAAGGRYVSPDIAQQIALQGLKETRESPFDQLSERELQICLMIVGCHKVQSIAEQLHISAKTVNSYRYRIFEKLDISGDVELTLMAIRHGLVESPAN